MEGGRNNENKAKAYGLLQLGWSHPSSQVWNCWQVWQILGKQSRTVLSLSTPPVTCEISPVSPAPLTSLTSHAVNNRMLEGRGFLNIVVLTNPFICRLALVNGVRGGARKQRKGRTQGSLVGPQVDEGAVPRGSTLPPSPACPPPVPYSWLRTEDWRHCCTLYTLEYVNLTLH